MKKEYILLYESCAKNNIYFTYQFSSMVSVKVLFPSVTEVSADASLQNS